MAETSLNGNVATSLGYSQYPYITRRYSLNGNPYKNNNYSLSPFWNYSNTEEEETNPYSDYQEWLEQNPGKGWYDYWNATYQSATNTPGAVKPASVKDDLDDDNSDIKDTITKFFASGFGKGADQVGFGQLKEARSNFKKALSAANTDDVTRHQAKKSLKGTDEWRALRNSRMTTSGVALGTIGDVANSILGDNEMYQGPKGDLTKGLDSAYDSIANGIAAAGPWGAMISGIMKAGSAVNSGLLKLGVGTDAMTNTDAILGSDFLALTPVGLINSIGAKKTDSFTLDVNAFKDVGFSYTGTWDLARKASEKSEKKYGLFSNGAYGRALDTINKAKQQLATVLDISKNATTRKAVTTSMNSINSNRLALQRRGGVKQNQVSVGLKGEKLAENLKRVKKISKKKKKLQMGGVIEPRYTLYPRAEKVQFSVENLGGEPVYIARPTIQRQLIIPPQESIINIADIGSDFPAQNDIIIPSNEEIQRMMDNEYSNIEIPNNEELSHMVDDLNAKGEPRSMEELIQYANEKNPRFILRMKEFPMILGFENDYAPTVWMGLGLREYGSHLLSWDEDDEGNAYVFPYIMEEHEGEGDLKKYSLEEARKLSTERGDYLVMSPEEADIFTNDTYKEFYPDYMSKFSEMFEFARNHPDMSGPAIRQLFMEKDGITSIPEYQEGGSIIPDGALHAHKHHIETDENITQKGIPVVIENKDGEIELVAEIEKGEIIFSKEFTEKLENLCKLYYNKEIEQEEKENVALEAGQLLVNEILNNTEDKTGELL